MVLVHTVGLVTVCLITDRIALSADQVGLHELLRIQSNFVLKKTGNFFDEKEILASWVRARRGANPSISFYSTNTKSSLGVSMNYKGVGVGTVWVSVDEW